MRTVGSERLMEEALVKTFIVPMALNLLLVALPWVKTQGYKMTRAYGS